MYVIKPFTQGLGLDLELHSLALGLGLNPKKSCGLENTLVLRPKITATLRDVLSSCLFL